MTDIQNVHFDNNVWNACVPLSETDLHNLNRSDAGAIVIKTVTLNPIQGNPQEYKLFDDHSTNNIALHNDGIDSMLQQLQDIKFINKPVFISVHGDRDEVSEMLRRIINADLDTKILIEWNLSCPNVMGRRSAVTQTIPNPEQLIADVKHFRTIWNGSFGVKPMIIFDKLEMTPLYQLEMAPLYNQVDFITAINTIEGVGGRRIHEIAVRVVRKLSTLTNTPIIGCGGVENRDDVNRFLKAGACAVEIGTAFLRHGIDVFMIQHFFTRNHHLRLMLKKHKIYKEGDFLLKNGAQSSIYFDFRRAPSFPNLWEQIIIAALDRIKDIEFDLVCGVPTGAVPLAAIIAHRCRKPLIQCRQTPKTHGIHRLIEGVYKEKQRVLLIEDVITTGKSALCTAKVLAKEGLVVKDLFCLLSRSLDYNLYGICVRSLFQLSEFIDYGIQVCRPMKPGTKRIVRDLHSIIATKNTKVCISIDFEDPNKIIDLLEKVGPYICMVKLHYDIIYETDRLRSKMSELYNKYNFMLFADRKIVDIPSIARKQIDAISDSECVDFITGFLHHGDSMVGYNESMVFLVASMSSTPFGLTDPLYIQRVIQATKHPCVAGLITQEKLCDDVLHLVPGVKLVSGTDGMGQKYRTPEDVKDFADVIIVGRGITEAEDPVEAVKQYRDRMN